MITKELEQYLADLVQYRNKLKEVVTAAEKDITAMEDYRATLSSYIKFIENAQKNERGD